MLSQDFFQIKNTMCQLQHKTLPPQIDVIQLKHNNSLKQIQYRVKHEDVSPTQRNDSAPKFV